MVPSSASSASPTWIPRRAYYCRVIACELNRIASHMIALGAMAMDVGAVTPFPWALRERERINDLIEELCGARLTYNYHRIGGVSFDMPKGWRDKCLQASSICSIPRWRSSTASSR
jgi:NADH-quinone oxidoreductase subunit D